MTCGISIRQTYYHKQTKSKITKKFKQYYEFSHVNDPGTQLIKGWKDLPI